MNEKIKIEKLKEFLNLKNKWNKSQFKPMRYKIKDSYMKISQEIYPYLDDITEIDGLVIKKAYQKFPDRIINYLQVYTKESYQRANNYLKNQNGRLDKIT